MGKMDRNTVIGFVLLALLFFGYFYYNRQGQLVAEEQARKEKARLDSIANLNKPKIDTLAAKKDSIRNDSAGKVNNAGGFGTALKGDKQTLKMENELISISFSNKGGRPELVELKKYNSFDSTPVRLVNGEETRMSYAINTGNNQSIQVAELYFQPGTAQKNADGSQSLSYTLTGPEGQSITHQYTLRPNSYLVDWNVQVSGADKVFTGQNLNMNWSSVARQHEKDKSHEKQQSQIGWMQDGDYDYLTVSSTHDHEFTKPLRWLSVKQQFFNISLIAKDQFATGKMDVRSIDSTNIIMVTNASLQARVPQGTAATIPFQIYYGPNDYKVLKSMNLGMENIVNLGQGIYAFVKYLNRYCVMPVFGFLEKFISSYGIIIALLTVFIRLLISPLTYRSYLSGAKMKALRPELDLIKQKFAGDQQALGMEQMKLYREAGVSPLGGCIPALLQIPIFFALFSFFNSSIQLRGENFLWAKDLSVYDTIATLPFSIPGYGSHVSLFTLLAVITSFLISIYSMSMTPDQNNPIMKYMPYFFPIILLGIFNNLPSALTWYYTVSNVITLALQWVIQKYIIDHDKILAQIEANKKKPKTKTKWQERIEQMQESQKKLQETREKIKKK